MSASTTSSIPNKLSVLFVCLGRSPLAEAVFADLVNRRGLSDRFSRIDSAGTAGYHIGEEPDDRSVACCRSHNVPINSTCRQVEASDFNDFDYIFAMDNQNLRNLEKVRPKGSKAQVKLFGDYGDGKVVQDPYYGNTDGFERVYQQCVRYSEGFLKSLGF